MLSYEIFRFQFFYHRAGRQMIGVVMRFNGIFRRIVNEVNLATLSSTSFYGKLLSTKICLIRFTSLLFFVGSFVTRHSNKECWFN